MHRFRLVLGIVVAAACGDPSGLDMEAATTGSAEHLREDFEAPFVVQLGPARTPGASSLVVFERAHVPGFGDGTVLVEGSRLLVREGVASGMAVSRRHAGSPTIVEPALGHAWPPRVQLPTAWATAGVDHIDEVEVESVRWILEGFDRAVLVAERGHHALPEPFEVVTESVWWDGASVLMLEAASEAAQAGGGTPRAERTAAGGGGASRRQGERAGPALPLVPDGGQPSLDDPACYLSHDCGEEEVCVIFEVDGHADRQCVTQCYEATFDGFWCTDDASCCDEEHVCHAGHCMTPEEAATSQPDDVPSDSAGGGGGCGSGRSGSSSGCGASDDASSAGDGIGDGCNACSDTSSSVSDACTCRTRGPSPAMLVVWLAMAAFMRPRPQRRGGRPVLDPSRSAGQRRPNFWVHMWPKPPPG